MFGGQNHRAGAHAKLNRALVAAANVRPADVAIDEADFAVRFRRGVEAVFG